MRLTALGLSMQPRKSAPRLPPTTSARPEARISTDLPCLLKRAADLQGRTMTDFVVAAVQDAARRAIEQAEMLRLSRADQECFAQALQALPPVAPPALTRALAPPTQLAGGPAGRPAMSGPPF